MFLYINSGHRKLNGAQADGYHSAINSGLRRKSHVLSKFLNGTRFNMPNVLTVN